MLRPCRVSGSGGTLPKLTALNMGGLSFSRSHAANANGAIGTAARLAWQAKARRDRM